MKAKKGMNMAIPNTATIDAQSAAGRWEAFHEDVIQ